MPDTAEPLRHADDLEVGERHDLGTWMLTSDEVLAFGRSWDPLPIHTDTEAAGRSQFGGLIASGIHSMAVLQRLSVIGFYSRTAVIAGRGFSELDLPRPIAADTTVRGTLTVTAIESRRPRVATVRTRSTLHDPSDRLVLEVAGIVLVRRRTPEDPRSQEDGGHLPDEAGGSANIS